MNSWYDWLVSHVPEPIRSATSRVKRQILRLYNGTEPREFEIGSSESAFRNFTERHTIQGVSGVDAISFLRIAKRTVIGELRVNTKFRVVLVCLMERPDPSGKEPVVKEVPVSNKTTTKRFDDKVDKVYDDTSEKIGGEYGEIPKRRERLDT